MRHIGKLFNFIYNNCLANARYLFLKDNIGSSLYFEIVNETQNYEYKTLGKYLIKNIYMALSVHFPKNKNKVKLDANILKEMDLEINWRPDVGKKVEE